MPDENHLLHRLLFELGRGNLDAIAYVYKTNGRGKPIAPYWFTANATLLLIEDIQQRGGGTVRIMIRQGRAILFSGTIAFAARLC
jgi:hypothetical protein